MLDLLIRGGRVVDGIASTWYRADVGVQGDSVVVLRGDTSSVQAARVIDATGCVVCPGFIDMHSHSDLAMLVEPRHDAKVRQGVTTEALGMDGLAYAPISPKNLEPLLRHTAAINGEAPRDVRWSTVKEFLDLFDGRVACNVAYFVPHAAVRVEAMGWDARLPTPDELRRMRELVRQGVQDGAFGFSAGLTYAPGAYSDTNEVADLCRAMRDLGGIYVTHARYTLGDRLLDPFREAVAIGRESGVPVHISHYHSSVQGMGQKMTALVDEGHSAGVDVTYDQYPYPAASTLLHSLLPYWVHAGGPYALLERIKDPRVRDQIADDIYPQWGGGPDLSAYTFSCVPSAKNKEWEGRSVTDLARAQGKRMVDAICDLLIEENLGVAFVARTGNEENIRAILRHPAQMVGSDGILTGDRPNPRSFGTFPYVLEHFARREGLISVEEAVRKMTSLPAQRLGLRDRGVLRDGMKADIVVFDPDAVSARATFEDPKRYPEGIRHVIVNGQPVIADGQHTGALPGQALRR